MKTASKDRSSVLRMRCLVGLAGWWATGARYEGSRSCCRGRLGMQRATSGSSLIAFMGSCMSFLFLSALASPTLASDLSRDNWSVFELSLSTGIAGIEGQEAEDIVFSVSPRVFLYPWWDPCGLAFPPEFFEPGEQGRCTWLAVTVGLIDPWEIHTVSEGELERGSASFITADFGLEFDSRFRLRPSAFFGAGLFFEESEETSFGDQGIFRIDDSTSPMISYGFRLDYPLTDRMAVGLEAKGLSVFTQERTVESSASQQIVLDGGVETTAILSLSLTIGF